MRNSRSSVSNEELESDDFVRCDLVALSNQCTRSKRTGAETTSGYPERLRSESGVDQLRKRHAMASTARFYHFCSDTAWLRCVQMVMMWRYSHCDYECQIHTLTCGCHVLLNSSVRYARTEISQLERTEISRQGKPRKLAHHEMTSSERIPT